MTWPDKSKRWIPLAHTHEVPPGEARVYECEGEWIALCNVDDQFYAVEDRCSHDDGPLGDGSLVGHQIECPRHGACFDIRSGQLLRKPGSSPIRVFPVVVKGHTVLVQLAGGEPTTGEPFANLPTSQ